MDVGINSIDDEALADTPVDLACYVQEVKRFSTLLRPLAQVYVDVQDIRRWRAPKVSLILLVIGNIAGLILTRGAVFLLASCLIFLISGLCTFHVHTRILDKILPETQYNLEEYKISEETTEEPMKDVKEFRVSLVQIYLFLMRVNRCLTRFYSLLKWDDFQTSLRFYVTFCGFLLVLIVFPARWNYLIFNNWFFLSHKRVEKYVKRRLLQLTESKIKVEKSPEVTKKNVADITEATNENGDVQKEDDTQSPLVPEKTSSGDSKSLSDFESESSDSDAICQESTTGKSVQKGGMVSRILEFKRKKQQMMTGICHGCQASFTSILKRRHYCRHCGNHFCVKCCSQKAPRSVFGATSPQAQKESVLVCDSCYNILVTKGLKVL